MVAKEQGNRDTEKMCISVEEMAESLGISRSQAYQLARQKGFPSIRLNRRIIIPVVGINSWLAQKAEENGYGESI